MKDKFLQSVETHSEVLFPVACDIFDHPELGREEFYASKLLTDILKEKGFTVEMGIAGLPTAFRAVWEQGSGGPAVGFLVEYDALNGLGHGCGHHMQGPTCFCAAFAMMEAYKEPFKIVIYGTPDEERNGGKIVMEKAGCFRDADVMFAYHVGGGTSVSYSSRALMSQIVTFHGTPSHASASPDKGRSALDAMLLTFQGVEFMREHVKDDCRMQYTILEGTGATNIVHETAKARITLRSYDRFYLEDMKKRLDNIIKGACLMTDTTADTENFDAYWNLVSVDTLRELVYSVEEELGAKNIRKTTTGSGGSTDVGNVSWVVPTANIHVYACDSPLHSEAYLLEAKSEKAKYSMMMGAKILGLSAMKILSDKELLEKIQAEHKEVIQAPDKS